ncbi:hypothetical protein Ahy_A03g013352 [Arachis hypogaea]|uniref:At2g35280-like TPR domain-containing protein n=1 Tax=Arachis hypogaea TaxID=3818 RepID=A0A445DVG0_ARAHY|nr:hypothetical protein Ahy_A03g013352 [Arachis hypogaea]
MTEFVWIDHSIGGMDTLTMAAIGGDLEACYICVMLLLSHAKEDEEHMRKGLEFFEIVRDSGVLERCREVFMQVFTGPWVEVKPLDPGLPKVCRSISCRTRGTMGDVEDLSHVSVLVSASAMPLQMAGSSKTNRKKGNVPIEHECQLNLLPRDIWVRIAAKVSCKVFLDAASSEAVYQHATMRVILLVSFLFYLDQSKRRFLDHCIEAENADAILRLGLTEYFWIACRGIGMELLARASTEGSVEAGYLFAMLLLCDHEDEEEVQRGVEMLEFIRTSGKVERCREFFERWVDERPSDPRHAVACWSTNCFTRSTMADVNDVSRVSCVHRLADYKVRVFLEMFRFY